LVTKAHSCGCSPVNIRFDLEQVQSS